MLLKVRPREGIVIRLNAILRPTLSAHSDQRRRGTGRTKPHYVWAVLGVFIGLRALTADIACNFFYKAESVKMFRRTFRPPWLQWQTFSASRSQCHATWLRATFGTDFSWFRTTQSWSVFNSMTSYFGFVL